MQLKNLLSIECASEKEMRVIFEDDKQSVYFYKKNNKLIIKGNKLNNKLYKLNFIPVFVTKVNVLMRFIIAD